MELLQVFERRYCGESSTLSKEDKSLVESVRKSIKVDTDAAKVQARRMMRAALGLAPDVVTAADERRQKEAEE